MKPIVDELEKEYEGRIEFRILDVDQPETEKESRKYGLTTIPMFIFIDKAGNQVDKVIGSMTKSEFKSKLEKLLD